MSRVKILVVVVISFVLTSTVFGVGLVIGHVGLPAGVAGVLPAPDGAWASGSAPAAEADFDTFWQAWDLVQEHFVDREALDETQLEYGAIEGMIQALGDEGHTAFLTPEEMDRRQADLSGTFSGIGALLGVRDGLPLIVAPFDGSPADQAGIKAGDIIMEVDGEDVTSLPLNELVEKIRGEEGTAVVLTILRPDSGESLEIEITRGEIVVPTATWAMVPGTDVALIRLSQFSANAEEQMIEALREAGEGGADRLIVDVRNNPGGLLDQAIRVTSQFLTSGNVLLEEDAQGQRKPYPVKPRGVAPEIPLVVLVNEGSASSAEIFAGAIQDQERGLIVGETTFGTGTVLRPFTLDDGSGLMLGTSQWLTPNGRLIRKQGIEPDVVVEMPMGTATLQPGEVRELTAEELLESEDIQLLKALELLEALPASDIADSGLRTAPTPSGL